MTKTIKTDLLHADMLELAADELSAITGGAGKPNFAEIRAKAQEHCPTTAAKYANVDPASVTRSQAQRMGNSCLAEMGSFKAAFARGTIQDAIDKAFPR